MKTVTKELFQSILLISISENTIILCIYRYVYAMIDKGRK